MSLEANPGCLSTEYLRGLRDIGFNRLSIGVQSFDDDELARARPHPLRPTMRGAAFASAREAGFDNVNLDFIYGLPEQPLRAWQRTLEEALALGPEHLSLYALTVEEGTPLARDVARGRMPAPDPDMQADHYEWTQERLARAGYEHYEISNWARPGHRCRHNLIYWQNREYLGLGAGAHSFLNGVRFSTVLLPNRYVELVDESLAALDGGAGEMRHVAGARADHAGAVDVRHADPRPAAHRWHRRWPRSPRATAVASMTCTARCSTSSPATGCSSARRRICG